TVVETCALPIFRSRPGGWGALSPNLQHQCERLFMRQLQLLAHGEPSDVIELNTVAESVLGQGDVLISMEAAPLNPSDFVLVRGMYGIRPAFPSPVGAEGVGRVTQTGSTGYSALKGNRLVM